jgi:hypothetical protein
MKYVRNAERFEKDEKYRNLVWKYKEKRPFWRHIYKCNGKKVR